MFKFLSPNEEQFVKRFYYIQYFSIESHFLNSYHALKMDYVNKNCLNRLPSNLRNIGFNSKEDKFENISK